MEAILYRRVYRLISSLHHTPRAARQQFNDRAIVCSYLWAALHDRPTSWACTPAHWPPALLGGRALPSPATMSRRLRTLGVLQLLERALAVANHALAAAAGPTPLVKVIDSKPLTVGASSRDRDARRGRLAAGIIGRGYRLHAIINHDGVVHPWTLASLNVNDAAVATRLLPRLGQERGGYVVGDNAYDSNALHTLAAAAAHRLVAPPRACNRNAPRDPRYNGASRLRALDLLDPRLAQAAGLPRDPKTFGQALYAQRGRIERCFGTLSMSGLDHLPTWVRGPRRVATWVAAKLLLHATRCLVRQRLRA